MPHPVGGGRRDLVSCTRRKVTPKPLSERDLDSMTCTCALPVLSTFETRYTDCRSLRNSAAFNTHGESQSFFSASQVAK